ncbi:MAG: hypothetical protein Kow0029_05810 [Candidatus Rifleibacteriota bacterium]
MLNLFLTAEFAAPVAIMISLCVMLLIWQFIIRGNRENENRLSESYFRIPALILFFIPVYLLEKAFSSALMMPYWLLVIFAAPLIEETVRFFITDLLETTDFTEGFFLGIFIGICESLFLLFSNSFSPLETMFRVIATQPLHAIQTSLMHCSKFSFATNIFIHVFFNLGIFLSGLSGIVLSLTVLTLNIARLMIYISEPNEDAYVCRYSS